LLTSVFLFGYVVR